MNPATRRAIELAWFERVSVHTLAVKYKMTASGIRDIWRRAKARGDLPRIVRPYGGPASKRQREHVRKMKRAAA